MHNLLYQMRQTAPARIAAILKARPKEVMPSARPTVHEDSGHSGLPVNGAAPTAPEDEQAEFEQWEREAWGV